MIAIFKAGNKRKTSHNHLFLPKNYSGDPTISVFKHHTEAEVLLLLEMDWGIGNVSDLQLSFLYGDDHYVFGLMRPLMQQFAISAL
jgi:hypothetical protein